MWITRRPFARICECLTGHLRSYGTVKVRIDVTFWTNHIARNQCSNTTPSHHGQATIYCITKIFQCLFLPSTWKNTRKTCIVHSILRVACFIHSVSQSVIYFLFPVGNHWRNVGPGTKGMAQTTQGKLRATQEESLTVCWLVEALRLDEKITQR